MSIDIQSNTNWDSILCQLLPIGCQLITNRIPIDIQSDINWLPIGYQLTPNWIPVDIQSDSNWDKILGHLSINQTPIDIQSDANWHQIWYQLTSNVMAIESQTDPNWQPIGWQLTPNPMLIDCQSDVNGHPIFWKLSHSPPIQCQLRSKTLDWSWFRFVRVPPLKIFWGTSRPMRSQHSELSTNQKPRFRPDSHCWPNLKSTNPRQMCQLTANGMSLNCNWNVN